MRNIMKGSIRGILAAIAIVIFVGCSGSSPLAPTASSDLTSASRSIESSHQTAPSLWGYWTVVLDPSSRSVEITPLRGAEFTVNVVSFLQPPAGKISNLGITITDLSKWPTEGKLAVDVKLTHPFPGLNQYTGHDVRGVFIAPGDTTGNFDQFVVYASRTGEQPKLLNADGLTRWYNPSEFPAGPPLFAYGPGKLGTPGDFNATINPYKYFAENIDLAESVADYFADPANLADRGQFRAGSTIGRSYELQFPLVGGAPQLVFQYAVLASWVEPTDLDPSDLPGSFPLEANAYEPVNLSVADNSTLYNTGTEKGGDIRLDLEIYGWPMSPGGNLLDRIAGIIVESPSGVIPGNYSMFDPAYIAAHSAPGTVANSAVVSIRVPGCTPPSLDDQELLVIVQTDGDYSNGGAGMTYPETPLAAYWLHYTHVAPEALFHQPVVDSIVPDSANQHEFVDNAVITGSYFTNITSVRLEMGANVIEADNFTVDSFNQITADFDLDGADYGLYDVVVENSEGMIGKLVDGFEIFLVCGTTAPSFGNVYTLSTFINTNYVIAVLNAGPYNGYTIFPECNVVSGAYRVFDHMTQANNTPFDYWSSFAAAGNALMMEPANHNGLIIVGPAYSFTVMQVINQTTGALVQSLPTGYFNSIVGDFDANDDFWVIVHQSNPSFPNMYDYYLQHWAYDSSKPTMPYTKAQEFNVNTLFRDDVGVNQAWEVFGDLVILPDASYCYVLTGAQGADDHKVDKVDLTGPAPVIVASHSFAGEGLDSDGQISIAQSRSVKMELDTSNPAYIPCRLIVAGSKYVSAENSYHMNFYRFDTDLNLLGSTSVAYNINTGSGRKFYGMALDMPHKVVVHLTEFPWSGPLTYYGVTPLPADW
jgi:hypothetical protein